MNLPSRPFYQPFLYWFCKSTVFVLLKGFWRLKVIGREYIPAQGGVIIAANHRSLTDPPVVGSSIMRAAHFMAKEELFQFGPFAWLISNLNAHPLRRSGDVKAFRLALNLLNNGEVVILFPEGRRSKTEALGPAKPGVGLLSKSTGCAIVPTYLHNTDLLSKGRKVFVQFSKPIYPAESDSAESLANAVMARIQEMKTAFETESR